LLAHFSIGLLLFETETEPHASIGASIFVKREFEAGGFIAPSENGKELS
jgi:hypothetical protein